MSAGTGDATRYASALVPGSFVIERYSYDGVKGGKGVQWCLHRVERDGSLAQIEVFGTRRAAAERLAEGV